MAKKNSGKDSRPLIYHIITKLELGGAQRVTLDTLRNINREKWRVGLIAGSEGELVDEARKLEDCDIIFLDTLKHPIRPFNDIRAVFIIRRILKKNRVSIVHTHSSKAGIVGRWGAFLADVPVRVHSVHGWSFNDYQNLLKKMIFIILEKITAKVTTYFFLEADRHIKIGLEKRLLRKQNYSKLLPGINFSFFDVRNKKKNRAHPFGLENVVDENKKIISMISCLKPQKAPLDFVRAAAEIIKSRDDAHFLIVGDGELRNVIEDEIDNFGIGRFFSLLGWRRDIPDILASSDLLVLTSLWEGMPTVIPIAFRMGVPVIANRVDGCAEIIEHGMNGLLSEPGDSKSIAGNIMKILDDDKLAAKLIKRSYQLTQNFEVAVTTKLQEHVYNELLARHTYPTV